MDKYTKITNPAAITDIINWFSQNGFKKPVPKSLLTYEKIELKKPIVPIVLRERKMENIRIGHKCRFKWMPINYVFNEEKYRVGERGVKMYADFRTCKHCSNQLTLYNVHGTHEKDKCEICFHNCRKVWLCIHCKFNRK
jgi:hypothetical protein